MRKGGRFFWLSFFSFLFLWLGSQKVVWATDYTWAAGGDGDWNTATNWNPNGVPGSAVGDTATISSGDTVTLSSSLSNPLSSLTVSGGSTFRLTGSNWTFSAETISLSGNSSLIIDEDNTQGNLITISATNISIEAGSSLNADETGFPAGSGDGAGESGSGGLSNSGGGGYGGKGGKGKDWDNYQGGAGGGVYGSLLAPVSLGSGGGYPDWGGAGGGAVRLDVSGTLTVNGTISANGGNSGGWGGGGGSGGSVYLTVGTLTGSGVISANGGDGSGGGGGGGRVAIYYQSNTFSGSVRAYGGNKGNSEDRYGAAGTIYLKDTNNNNSQLIIDNNNRRDEGASAWEAAYTPLNSSLTVTSLTLKNKGELEVVSGITLSFDTLSWEGGYLRDDGGEISYGIDFTVGNGGLVLGTSRSFTNLTLQSGAVLSHPGNKDSAVYKLELTVSGNLTVESGAQINVDQLGYIYAQGPGAPSGSRGGGGHGGGGGAADNGSGGSSYGSLAAPVTLGSGGGDSSWAGNGGGAIKLTVNGTLTINGNISANGGTSSGWSNGGGSGGSIYLIVGTLTGSGSIEAEGGGGDGNGGGGSGGRVAIYYQSNTFSGTVSVAGGSGYQSGESGTVVKKATRGELISTPFDTGDPGTIINSLSWSESLASGTDVKFQLRTAPDDNGSPGTWSEWLGPGGADTYYTDPNGGETVNSAHSDSSNDQWFQYKMILTANSGDTNIPTVTEVVIEYVINTTPSVSLTNYPQESSQGKVTVNYTASDPEESTATVSLFVDVGLTLEENLAADDTGGISLADASLLPSSGTIMIDNEVISYTQKSGNDLTGTITRGAENTRAASHSSSAVVWFKATAVSGDVGDNVSFGSGKSIVWTVKDDIEGLETETGRVKVVVNDGQGANQLGEAVSSSLILDSKAPVNTGIVINSRQDQLVLSASDGAAIRMKISNNADLSPDGVNPDSGQWIDFATTKSWQMPSGTERVYVRFKDVYGNEGSTLSTTAPSPVSGVLIQDASNPESDDWRLFISWVVADEPEEGFAYYQVYRSLDNESFSAYTQINNRLENYYLDSGLNNTTTYYYRVTVVDNHGNESSYNEISQVSGSASKSGVGLTPDGSGGGDFTAPVISEVTVSNITSSGATISWSTDELADSTVGYSTDTSYENEVGSVTMTTSHSVTLTGLAANTKYYYRVISYDAVSNRGVEEDSSVYYFTTLGDTQGPVISNIKVVTGETSAGITWSTNEPATSVVEYGLDTSYGSSSSSGELVYGHAINLSNLMAGTTYHYRVRSTDNEDNETISSDYTFTTATTTSADTTAPTISNIAVSDITATSAKISWSTNEAADGKVEYGESASYERGVAEGNHDFDTDKNVVLIGLSPATTYHYRIIAIDKSGNINTSSDSTFTTASLSSLTSLVEGGTTVGSNAPSITSDGPTVVSISGTEVKISWKTTKKATSEVFYKVKGSLGAPKTGGEANIFVTDHEVVLTNLTPATTYEYQVKSADVNYNYIISPKYEFTTSLPDITQVKVEEVTENSALISWVTAVPTQSSVEYFRAETKEGEVWRGSGMKTTHQARLTGLYPSSVYLFTILIEDEGGNQARSQQYSFTTKNDSLGPKIRGVTTKSTLIAGQDKIQTVISWTTDEPAAGWVEYSLATDNKDKYEKKTKEGQDFVVNHIVVVADLKPATVYRFRVISRDRAGNLTTSEPYVFLTPQRRVSAVDLILQNLESVFGWTRKLPFR